MTKQARVRWTDDEWALLRRVAISRLSEYPGADNMMLLRQGQNLLPDGRQRKLTPQVIFTMKDFFNEIREEVAATLKDKKQAPEIIYGAPPISPVEAKQSLEVVLRTLIDTIADRVAERISAQLEIKIEKAHTAHSEYPPPYVPRPKHNPEPPCNATREPRIGVLILGMQPHQAHLVKQEFPELDITCYDSDEARTKPVLLRAHVIAMTRFLSHQVDDRYKKSPRYHRHPTGMTELKTLLLNIQRGEV